MFVRAEFYDICHPRHLQELSPRTTRDLDYDLNHRQAAKPVKGLSPHAAFHDSREFGRSRDRLPRVRTVA